MMTTSTGWQLARDAAERYQEILVPTILGPAAIALVEGTNPRPGEAVLDVGCGTGAATRRAAELVGASGRVVGLDINAGMLEVARSLPTPAGASIEWRERGAEQVASSGESFDLILCAQTLQFLPDRPRVLTEIRRALAPGGRFALSLWCPISENPYFDALVRAIAEHIAPQVAAGLNAAFALSEERAIRSLLLEGGFREIVRTVEVLDVDLPKAEEFVPRHIGATPMSTGYAAASAEKRRAVVADVANTLRNFQAPDGRLRVQFRTHLVLASA